MTVDWLHFATESLKLRWGWNFGASRSFSHVFRRFFLVLFFSRRNVSRFCRDRHGTLFVCLPPGSPRDSGRYPTVESVPSMNSLLFAQPPFRLPEPDDCSNINLSSLRICDKENHHSSCVSFSFVPLKYFSCLFYFAFFRKIENLEKEISL